MNKMKKGIAGTEYTREKILKDFPKIFEKMNDINLLKAYSYCMGLLAGQDFKKDKK